MCKGLSLILAVIFAQGCATAPVLHTFPGLDLNVVETSQKDVDRVCRREGSVWDDGSPVQANQELRGCWVEKDRTVYLDAYESSTELLLHELCHADGSRTRAECDRLF